MGYGQSLEAAGATVLKFKEFGDYQGTWWALVEYEGGKRWVNGSYGSCSGCDSFQAEFDYLNHDCLKETYYNPIWSGFIDGCETCESTKQKLIAFGKQYLDNYWFSQEEAENHMVKRMEGWKDKEDEEILEFLKNNRI